MPINKEIMFIKIIFLTNKNIKNKIDNIIKEINLMMFIINKIFNCKDLNNKLIFKKGEYQTKIYKDNKFQQEEINQTIFGEYFKIKISF